MNIRPLSAAADELWVSCCYGKGNRPVELTADERKAVETAVRQLTDILAGQEDYETMIRRKFPWLRPEKAA